MVAAAEVTDVAAVAAVVAAADEIPEAAAEVAAAAAADERPEGAAVGGQGGWAWRGGRVGGGEGRRGVGGDAEQGREEKRAGDRGL